MANNNSISTDDVKHIAKLAKLTLTDDEVTKFSDQLSDVIGYVEKLDELDTEDVEPTFQVLDGTTNVLREDIVEPSLTQGEALYNGKKTHDGYFVVDRLIED